MKRSHHFNFMATGVGSVPFLDVNNTCKHILRTFPDIPFWPQFVKRSYLEDMFLQVSEGLPFFGVDHERHTFVFQVAENRERELISFYEHFMANDSDYFAISEERAIGLYTVLDLIEGGSYSNGAYIKGQIIGPVSLAGGLKDSTGKAAFYNGEVRDALVKGLAIKALWIIKKLSASGRIPILFIDEPYLSGFGSAFTSIRREEVIKPISEIIEYIRSHCDALIGIHCCGNTDWTMIIETGVDIVSFDAFEYMNYFLLYRDEITRFLSGGGTIAWGVVPTTSFGGKESVIDLRARLEKGLSRLCEWGIGEGTIAERSIITPACGLGTLEIQKAEEILEVLSTLSSIMSGVQQ